MEADTSFSFDSNGNVTINKGLVSSMINEDTLPRGKKTYCCTTYSSSGGIMGRHQYKEQPILAELVCIRHAAKDGASRGSMSKGECPVHETK